MARDRWKGSEVEEGEWYQPTSKHRERCCDCGLIHIVEYKVEDGKIWMRVWRDNAATARTKERKSWKERHGPR